MESETSSIHEGIQNQSLVSVIIPMHRQFLIQRAISSVIAQSYKNIEIIVVDDNDNDSERIIKTISADIIYKHIPPTPFPARST